MLDSISNVLYWFINLLILIAGVIYSIKIWDDKLRTLKGVALFLGGFLWHFFRALFNYLTNRCEPIDAQDSFFVLASQCIPATSFDIILAQIAIFVGLFIIIAEIYSRSTSHFYAGLDLGTSGCRITVIDKASSIKYTQSIAYKENIKQTPELWWDSVTTLLMGLPPEIKEDLVSIAVDGTSGSILLVDAKGNPTSSVLMYNDLRATEEAEKIKKVLSSNNGGQGVSSSLARLLWLLEHEPNAAHCHAVHQADYILGKLSNNYQVSDENNCLKLGYDVIERCWPKNSLKKLGIDLSLLPRVYPAGTSIAKMKEGQAKVFGFLKPIEIITGTTDSIAAFIATGADNVGEAVTSLGSTLVLKVVADKPIFSSKHGVYSHRLNDLWLIGGASNSGSKVLLAYFTLEEIKEMTPQIDPERSTGLAYYPLLTVGERFPIADSKKKPILYPRPESDIDFFQGMLEGIANIEQLAYTKLQELGAPEVKSIRSVGGGASNKAWTQIRKYKLKRKMIEPKQTEAAYGSALLAKSGYTTAYTRNTHD